MNPDLEIHLERWSAKDLAAIAFAMVFPTLVTLVYFQWLESAESSMQQIAFGIGKTIQFGFPLVWIWIWHRSRLTRQRESDPKDPSNPDNGPTSIAIRHAILIGVIFGVAVVAAMFILYFLWIAPSEIGAQLVGLVKEKVADLGISSFWIYAAMGVFYALCHSFLEEYYWRWFVFAGLEKFMPVWAAIAISSLGFMAHHVVLLGFYFDWQWMTYPVSFCIAVGGMFWAWQFHLTDKLRPSWISHLIVDAGIFALGYVMIRDML